MPKGLGQIPIKSNKRGKKAKGKKKKMTKFKEPPPLLLEDIKEQMKPISLESD